MCIVQPFQLEGAGGFERERGREEGREREEKVIEH